MIKINTLLIAIIIPVLCFSHKDRMQSIGSTVTYVLLCPCKLFKYYESGVLFYACEDTETNIKYKIKEMEHQDVIDRFFNALDEKLYGEYKNVSDSVLNDNKEKAFDDYLKKNPNGLKIDFMDAEAIIVSEYNKQKLFFLDDRFLASYIIEVSGEDINVVKKYFNKLINSLMVKSENFKKIF
tara:strand:+ start:145 stop:690 length:546 start_codon:yes stop_codon:yes gene_type:complete